MLDLTDPERQFIEAMRQASDNLLLVVERIGRGGWEIEMSTVHEGKRKIGPGAGKTFSEAWDNVVAIGYAARLVFGEQLGRRFASVSPVIRSCPARRVCR
jgi:hypothetical protein